MPNIPITIGNPCIAISRPDKRLNKFLQGGVISSFSMPKEVKSIAPHAFANIGGLQEIVFTNQDDVVEVSDDAGIAPSVKFVVPEQLMVGYQERYPERTIVSYATGYEWTIPYVEGETSTTLTMGYVNECLSANPDAKKASKVVVPPYFTRYERGVFTILFQDTTITKVEIQQLIPVSLISNIEEFPAGSEVFLKYAGTGNAETKQIANNQTVRAAIHIIGFSTIGLWTVINSYLNSQLYVEGNCTSFVSQCFSTYGGPTKFWLLTDALPTLVSISIGNSPIYLSTALLQSALVDSGWSNQINATRYRGYLDYDGTVPTFSGYTATWYFDENCTIMADPENFVQSNRYYVKLTTNA